ncbi:MAG: chemotaxis protein CheW [Bacillota bacterium]
MSVQSNMEPMLELFCFETSQYLGQLEQSIIDGEKLNCFSEGIINEVFRIMHNIKSSSAMMNFTNISSLAHNMEDLFFFLREEKPQDINYSILSDLLLDGVDFIKVELEKIKNGDEADGDSTSLIASIKDFLAVLKPAGTSINNVRVVVYFEEGCEMENVRAFSIVHRLQDIAQEIHYLPEDIMENDLSAQVIKDQGFIIKLKTNQTLEEIQEIISNTAFVRDLEVALLENNDEINHNPIPLKKADNMIINNPQKEGHVEDKKPVERNAVGTHQQMISVNVKKLDILMDLVGEMVIAEAMVSQNPDLKDLELNNFKKASQQLRKIINEVQDIVMSIRMVPLTVTFQKMNRIVRDMSKKLNKEVVLEIFGEETEVDKNIIERITDPLMHLIRNAIDHGLESSEERKEKGKTEPAKVIIEARNAGSDVLISVTDNGKGLDKEQILRRAKENGLLRKPEKEMTDREIFNLIFLPGFSTKENATEFSGRGVGMDVVTKNIETIGGSVLIDSLPNEGTTITLKIPLTLAIISGMNIRVGKSCYTIPITSIKECFRPKENEVFTDPEGNEMIMVRGKCLSIVRLYEIFKIQTDITDLSKGILIIIENEDKAICLFADELLGEQQVVVKALPTYIKKIRKLAGCALLGDGSISLILDIAGFFETQS